MKASRTPADVIQMMTMRDVCEALRISRRTAQRLIAVGDLPRYDKKVGRGLRWKRETIEKWLSES